MTRNEVKFHTKKLRNIYIQNQINGVYIYILTLSKTIPIGDAGMIPKHVKGMHITNDTDDKSAPSEVKAKKNGADIRRRLESLLEEAKLLRELSEDEYYK